jgi:hypothetical protein
MSEKYFGFWGAADGDGKLPSVFSCVDAEWLPADRNQLIEYLSQCPVAAAAASLRTPCLICGTPLCSSSYQSDNQWLWPEDLMHYVIEHNVKLPDALSEHIREAKYKWPTELTLDLDRLPWPE